MKRPGQKIIHIYIADEIHYQLKKLSADEKTNITQIITTLVKAYLLHKNGESS